MTLFLCRGRQYFHLFFSAMKMHTPQARALTLQQWLWCQLHHFQRMDHKRLGLWVLFAVDAKLALHRLFFILLWFRLYFCLPRNLSRSTMYHSHSRIFGHIWGGVFVTPTLERIMFRNSGCLDLVLRLRLYLLCFLQFVIFASTRLNYRVLARLTTAEKNFLLPVKNVKSASNMQ